MHLSFICSHILYKVFRAALFGLIALETHVAWSALLLALVHNCILLRVVSVHFEHAVDASVFAHYWFAYPIQLHWTLARHKLLVVVLPRYFVV